MREFLKHAMGTHGLTVARLESEGAGLPPHLLEKLPSDRDGAADLSSLDGVLSDGRWVQLGVPGEGEGAIAAGGWEGAAASVCEAAAARPWSAAEGGPLIQMLMLSATT